LKSLYDLHGDRSGDTPTSIRRPKATLRDDYRYPLSNSPHLLPVDLHFLRFCGANGIGVDLLTDHDLDAEGIQALQCYSGLFTGSHPEYWSPRMMAALDQFLDGGGNLAYQGGNGFYWVVAIEGALMELRRDASDSLWTSPGGELHMALSGEPGRHWEARGRPTQSFLGSTYLMMSFGPSRHYKRLPGSMHGEFAGVFAGVDAQPIGDSGIVLGGAAGYEVGPI